MSLRKEIWILFVGFLSLMAVASIFVSLFVFRSWETAIGVAIGIYFVDTLLAFHVLNSKKRSPNVKMCWIFVILGIPLIGFVLFCGFGINPLRRLVRKRYRSQIAVWTYKEDSSDAARMFATPSPRHQVFAYVQNVQGRPIYANNDIEFLKSQTQALQKSLELIRNAKHFIHAQYYILSDGIWFRAVANELIRKAKAGVKVRLIYDWVGSYRRGAKRVLKRLAEAGVMIAVFNRKFLMRYTARTNFRCHRKCLIVDNELALYGGSNIGDEYVRLRPKLVYWEDLNIILKGRAVNTLNTIFAMDWEVNSYLPNKMRKHDDLTKNPSAYLTPVSTNKQTDIYVQALEKSPNYEDFSSSAMFASLFATASQRIWIATPYFLPDETVVQALCLAAAAGVDVRLYVPGLPDDKRYILTMNRAHYKKLLASGVKIYEYMGFMHSKLVVVDNDFVVISTMNFDFRSLFINYESALLIQSAKVNTRCQALMRDYEALATRITKTSFSQREFKNINWKMAFMNVFHPLL